MGRSSESFNKREKEKKRQKKAQDKAEKMGERKANAKKGKSLDDMIVYIDEDGNFSSTPPDPMRKRIINVEDIEIGVKRHEASEEDNTPAVGVVNFFNSAKGFGFIKETATGDSYFVHINELTEKIGEGDRVQFERGSGPKGPVALQVKKV
jgi:cold shock CspA family protein